MTADHATETAILAALAQLSQAYASRNPAALDEVFAPDPDVVMYGTGADEKRIGIAAIRAQAQRDWAQTDAVGLDWKWTSISAKGPVAWVAADAEFRVEAGGQKMRMPARITCVVEQRAGRWLIVHGHFSFPAAEQAEGQSFPHS